MLSVNMLSVVMLSAVVLSIMVPVPQLKFCYSVPRGGNSGEKWEICLSFI
jgi:hypothetical protein